MKNKCTLARRRDILRFTFLIFTADTDVFVLDKETRRGGDKEIGIQTDLLVSLSPSLLVFFPDREWLESTTSLALSDHGHDNDDTS
jgi:hypothetical protein